MGFTAPRQKPLAWAIPLIKSDTVPPSDRLPDRPQDLANVAREPSPTSARFRLRDETSAAHERVDALYSRFDLAADEGYAAFLTAQARAFMPVEAALNEAGAGDIVADWAGRLRSDALAHDLAALGLKAAEPLPAPVFTTEAEILGGAYVLEGSRLGGALLRRSVPADRPRAFMAASDPGRWRGFVAVLEQRLTGQAAIEQAISAALATFAVFERSATLTLGQDPL